MPQTAHKIIAIVGPTGSGKSALGVELAKRFNGEVISADSKQVYAYADIGTGKITKKEMAGIPHHCLSFVHPKTQCSFMMWRECAKEAIADILGRGKLPIIVGGTAFYINALTGNLNIPKVPPNLKLRKQLESKTTEELFFMLEGLDPQRASTIERSNKRRLVRAIEIVKETGSQIPLLKKESAGQSTTCILAIARTPEEIRKAIAEKQEERHLQGIEKEIKALHKRGLTWKRIRELGLDYRYLVDVVREKTTYSEAAQKLHTAIWRFTKRQMNWWKNDKEIVWVRTTAEATQAVTNFLKK